MKSKMLLCVICVFMLFINSTFSQTNGELKIEKKLYKLFEVKVNFKKCNRVAKRYIKNHNVEDEGVNSAYYYTSLTYTHYTFWNWTKMRILYGDPEILNKKPLNFIDSALRYNDLYLDNPNKKFMTLAKWKEELFDKLYTEIIFGSANQLILHKYPNAANATVIYKNHKEECDSNLMWIAKLYRITKKYYPEESLNLFTHYHSFKNEFLDLDYSSKQLDTLYDEFSQYLDLNNNIGKYSFMLPNILEIDTSQFYRFLHLVEEKDNTFNGAFFDWKEITIGFDYNKPTLNIWYPQKKTEDGGKFFVTENVRKNKSNYNYTYTVPFNFDVYPGDTLKIQGSDNENIVIKNLQDLQQIQGFGTDTLIIEVTDEGVHNLSKEREWIKKEVDFVVDSNRGSFRFLFVYRYEYSE